MPLIFNINIRYGAFCQMNISESAILFATVNSIWLITNMARPASLYVCQSCGSSHNRWAGKCEACGEWNSIVEESMQDRPPQGLDRRRGKVIELAPLSGTSEVVQR